MLANNLANYNSCLGNDPPVMDASFSLVHNPIGGQQVAVFLTSIESYCSVTKIPLCTLGFYEFYLLTNELIT
jgi:hypothetical protein